MVVLGWLPLRGPFPWPMAIFNTMAAGAPLLVLAVVPRRAFSNVLHLYNAFHRKEKAC
jgi:hypothetical protein